jgi:hypothetical protein
MNSFIRNLFLLALLNFIAVRQSIAQVPVINPVQGPAVVCLPATVPPTFSVSASNNPTSYSWSYSGPTNLATISNPSGSVTSVSFPTPSGSAVYLLYCYATNGSGNSSIDTFVVNIFQTPSITFSGANNFCQGGSTNLSASPTIFQASSTTISYLWTPATGLSSTTSYSVIASPPASTTYTVLASNGPCTSTNYFSVVVNALPTVSAVANPSLICYGQSSNLVLNGSANSYSVNSSPVPPSSMISPTTTTSYMITGSNQNGCTSVPLILIVTVDPIPVVSFLLNPPAICVGDTGKLQLGGSATIYSVNGVTSSQTLNVSPVITTTYNIIGANANGCLSPPSQLVLPVNALPVVSVTSNYTAICKGEKATLLFTGNSTSYSLNGTTSAAAVTVTPTAPVIYTVTGKNGNGCRNTVTYGLIVNGCAGIEEIAEGVSMFRIFPNPSYGNVSVLSEKDEVVVLTNELGETVQIINLTAGSAVEISGLRPGIYFATGVSVRKKIVVVH